MQLNLESPNLNAIQAYDVNQVQINQCLYTTSLIVGKDSLFPEWSVKKIEDLDEHNLQDIIALKPEIILIGSHHPQALPAALLYFSSQKKIGLESMDLGAACRTYNVLLSEKRSVVLGLIF